MKNEPRLLFAGLCQRITKVGMSYTLEGLTHHITTPSYPYQLDRGIVTCWELGDEPFTERIELLFPIKPNRIEGFTGDRLVKAQDPKLWLHTDCYFHAPHAIPLTVDENSQLLLRVLCNGQLSYQSRVTVQKVAS